MYDELVNRLRDFAVELRKAEDALLVRDAADAIEGLSEAYDKLSRHMDDLAALMPRWIPVTERLPKEGEFVLVYGDLYPNKHDGGVIAVSKRMDWNYWQGLGRERNITHWMPLPEPPKEE